ncbi:MAG TPA: CARDB domain-containing protein, partial [Solirubrobacterales bacterium]|nr:CARDB domain-containing protein [Solirubrobacterales bacterium]
KQATSGVHGLGLLQTTIQPGNATLDPSTAATITGNGRPEVEVQVQNQGDSVETGIGVIIQLTGGTQTISGDATIPRIAPGAIQTARIPIQPAPDTGTPLTLEVTVQPVPGEQVESNNRSSYQITFQ